MAKTATWQGLLVVDKPAGITSRDAVDRALGWFPRGVKLGHTGTLDPLATGVLVLTVGPATRLSEYVQRMRKTYRAAVRLGAGSDSDDADGVVSEWQVEQPPARDALEAALAGFQGTIDQTPPAYSALRTAGRRAFDLARRGLAVELAPRPVEIHTIQILKYEYPLLELEVECGKGTYIRSLARDLGAVLGCGGYIAGLRRLRVGPFQADDALSPDAAPDAARARLLPLSAALTELPRVTLPADDALRLCRGRRVAAQTDGRQPLPADGSEVAVFALDGQFLALAAGVPGSNLIRPLKVFAGAGSA
ncbi:MAG: tRNA pseudouridine(55) synthase TruB [Planctomycetia bacterium]|nr:tRNA pseudouridine(55) synthase TruB [Planctomycetia bacterium]